MILWMPHLLGAKLLLEDKVQSDLWLVTRIVELCRILPILPLPVPIDAAAPLHFTWIQFLPSKKIINTHIVIETLSKILL